jgi:hypothetical protein
LRFGVKISKILTKRRDALSAQNQFKLTSSTAIT